MDNSVDPKPGKSAPQSPPEPGRSRVNPFLQYSGLGLQMLVTIGLGVWLGSWLDHQQDNRTPIWTLLLALLSIAASIYLLIRGLPKQP
ncbi:MAG: AtpZ/AtpI family protein [Cytophagales bacterium]|nr:MAG: AtpZ/AtpI family protein [Cytophagales bacterium]